jgi:hypothetical protein
MSQIILKTFLNNTYFLTLNVLFLELMERMKIIIIILNYVVWGDFLGLVMSIEQPKFQLKFKGTTKNFDLKCQLDNP